MMTPTHKLYMFKLVIERNGRKHNIRCQTEVMESMATYHEDMALNDARRFAAKYNAPEGTRWYAYQTPVTIGANGYKWASMLAGNQKSVFKGQIQPHRVN